MNSPKRTLGCTFSWDIVSLGIDIEDVNDEYSHCKSTQM